MRAGSSLIGVAALALIVSGCVAGGTGGGGGGGGDQIVVQLDASIPDLAAATIVAERDCDARGSGRESYLLSAPSAPGAGAAAGPRRAVFACREVARRQGGGNQGGAGGAR